MYTIFLKTEARVETAVSWENMFHFSNSCYKEKLVQGIFFPEWRFKSDLKIMLNFCG